MCIWVYIFVYIKHNCQNGGVICQNEGGIYICVYKMEVAYIFVYIGIYICVYRGVYICVYRYIYLCI